jgi:DNA-binding XRE family transcriptional regulator
LKEPSLSSRKSGIETDFTIEDFMTVRKVMMSGRAYVLVPLKQWQALIRRSSGARAGPPRQLPPLAGGSYTLEHVRISLANKMAARRKAAGLTQQQLAKRAGVRAETISRLESALHMPGPRTFEKLERALKGRCSKPFAA